MNSIFDSFDQSPNGEFYQSLADERGFADTVEFYLGHVLGGSYLRDTNYAFDPAANSWSTKAQMPIGRYAFSGATLANANGHVFCGIGFTGYLSSIANYNFGTNSWATNTATMLDRGEHPSESVGGLGYVSGGRRGSGGTSSTRRTEVFDSSLDTVSTISDQPDYGRAEVGSFIIGPYFFCVEGAKTPWYTYINDNIRYFGGWSYRTSSGLSYRGLCATTIDDFGYRFCGLTAAGRQDDNKYYDNNIDSWTTKANHPVNMWSSTSLNLLGKGYTFGGADAVSDINKCYEYNSATNAWTQKTNMPDARQLAASFGEVRMNRLDLLLEDFRSNHSEYQMDNFIIGVSGKTDWGRYHQALRELSARRGILKGLYLERMNKQAELDAVNEKITSLEREFAHFFDQATSYKQKFSDITNTKRQDLDRLEWIETVRVEMAKDLLSTGHIGKNIIELLCAIPIEDRMKIIPITEEQKRDMVTWYLHRNLEVPKTEIGMQINVRQLVTPQ